ncbi:MAG: HAD hydrolase-like protein [Cyanophyceae cyanobacterium]
MLELSDLELVVFDKDGTLSIPKGGARFVQNPKDQVLLKGVSERLAELTASGLKLAIASNQGGVSAGFKRLEDAILEMDYAMHLAGINHGVFCPEMNGGKAFAIEPRSEANGQNTSMPFELLSGGHCTWLSHQISLDDSGEGVWRKPCSGMIDYLCRFYKVDPGKCLFVGDMGSDQKAAENAGAKFAWADDYFGTAL